MSSSIVNDHIWFSVFYRKGKSSFSRVQRLSCCLAILYLTMISNAMWYRTDEGNPQSGITIGPISITVNELYTSTMSTLTIIFPVLFIMVMFTKSAPRPPKGQRAVRGKGQLPWWCVYFGVLFVVLSVAVSAFFTILYSLQWGSIKSTAWLTCFLLSFFQSVVIVQPLKVR